MSVINVEEDDSKLPQSSPRSPQQGLVNEVSSVSHEHHAAEQQLARSGYVQQTTLIVRSRPHARRRLESLASPSP